MIEERSCSGKRLLPEEERLVHFDRPLMVDAARGGIEFGVETDDDMPLLQA